MDMRNLPAHLQGNRRIVGQESLAGMSVPPVPQLSIEGQRFTLVDAAGQKWPLPYMGPIFTEPNGTPTPGTPAGPYVDVVLVDANEHMSKTYYINPYTPGQATFTPPDCWSDNGIAPSANANSPQATRCDLCPHNKWGSKINSLGNEVKACDDVKKLAFYVLTNPPCPTIFLLRLKGSSHKNWSSYIRMLNQHQLQGLNRSLDAVDVVTRIYFDPEYPIGILAFTNIGFILPEHAQLQDRVWQARETDAMVGRLDKPRQLAITAGDPAAQGNLAIQGGQGGLQAQTRTLPPPPAQAGAPTAPPAGFGRPAHANAPVNAPAAASQGGMPSGFGSAHTGTIAGGSQQPSQQPAQQETAKPRGRPPRRAPAPQPPQTQTQAGVTAAAHNPPPNFGIQTGAPIGQDLDAALDNALKPLN